MQCAECRNSAEDEWEEHAHVRTILPGDGKMIGKLDPEEGNCWGKRAGGQ